MKQASKYGIEDCENHLHNFITQYEEISGKEWTPDTVPPPESNTINQNIEPVTPIAPTSVGTEKLDEATILRKIIEQGDKIRDLKTSKADKSVIEPEVKILLSLKVDYKTLTGEEWKPETVATVSNTATPTVNIGSEANILKKIVEQGEKVRKLKSEKSDKSLVDSEVKNLLAYKAEYKALTGKEWKPGTIAIISQNEAPTVNKSSEADILQKIAEQGDKVRQLKLKKAEKNVVDVEVKSLLAYKVEFKTLTGKDWKPGTVAAVQETKSTSVNSEDKILNKIASQGDKVRKLKSEKAEKATIDKEVKALLAYKIDYKSLTGKEWKPGTVASNSCQIQSPPASVIQSPPTMELPSPVMASGDFVVKELLTNKVNEQGNVVRNLKSSGAAKVKLLMFKYLLNINSHYFITPQYWDLLHF